MSNNIDLKKGLDLPISGSAELKITKKVVPDVVAVKPTDFKGFTPRLLVKEGDKVLAGSPVMADKKNPDILLTSPVSGEVAQIVRGEKRKLLAVLVKPDYENVAVDFGKKDVATLSADDVKKSLLESGLWPSLIQRPYGIIADPQLTPKAIFVSTFSTAPLAADNEFTLGDQVPAMQAAVTALSSICPVHVSVNNQDSPFAKIKNAEIHVVKGKHPAGNVGVQISHISPIQKEETVWTISPVLLAAIGKLFLTGKLNLYRKVAVTGPMAIQPAYVEALPGTPIKSLKSFYGTTADITRFVCGDILSGTNVGEDGYLCFFCNQISLLKEGTEPELFGWIKPFRFNLFSADHSYFHWCLGKVLMPKHTYDLDTNLHGGPRAFVMSDSYYSKVLPMDIFPIFLVKACMAGDIEKMEKFGIYEVLPEDLALCEFIDPSKNNIQASISKGIDLMLKEMA